MTIAEKLQTIAENEQRVFEAGKKAEYDKFWDNYQNYGNRTRYTYGFNTWEEKCFYPKYDIKPTGRAYAMFELCTVTDFKQRLIDCGVILDLSKASDIAYLFQDCHKISSLPTIDTTSALTLNYVFSKCFALVEIDKVVLKDNGKQTFNNTFANCEALQNLTIEGVIGTEMDIHWSTKLSRNSILSILQACKISVSSITITLPIQCIDGATGTLTLIESDTELNTAYNNALALGYTFTFL